MVRPGLLPSSLLLVLALAGCGGGGSSSATGSSSPSGGGGGTSSDLIGRVMDVDSQAPVPGAVVEVLDGAFAGRTATSAANGEYRFAGGASLGKVALKCTAVGYETAFAVVNIPALGPYGNFGVHKGTGAFIALTDGQPTAGTISRGDPACAGGSGPCQATPFKAGGSGTLTGILAWRDGGGRLGLQLVRGTTVLAEAEPNAGETFVVLRASLPAAGDYEARVRWLSSQGPVNYSLTGNVP
jgi:hypothetical protein